MLVLVPRLPKGFDLGCTCIMHGQGTNGEIYGLVEKDLFSLVLRSVSVKHWFLGQDQCPTSANMLCFVCSLAFGHGEVRKV